MSIKKGLFFGLLILALLILPLPGNAATETLDQQSSCDSVMSDDLNNGTKFPMYQVFQPSMNRLTKVSINFSNGASSDVSLTIEDMGGNQLGVVTRSVDVGWYDFAFLSPIQLNTGLNYQIHLNNVPSANSSWLYCQPGSYSRGYAVTGGTVIPDKDYMFKSYGYNESAPSPISPTVAPPENLTAKDVPDDAGGKILLSWQKSSTSGIDGYHIYRKSKEESDFRAVGEVDNKTLEYEDSGLENGLLYIYVVRAYKGNSESSDSNEARATPENNLALAVPKNLRIVAKGIDYLEVAWDKVDDERLDKYVILFGENPTDFMTEREVVAERTFYRAEGLKSGTRYYFKAASKSKDGQTSGFSDLISDETESVKKGLSWFWILSIIIFVLALLGLYLFIAYLKKWWPFRQRNLKTQDSKIKTDNDIIKELPGKKGNW